MTLQDYLRVVRRSWWLIVISLLIGLVAGLVFTRASTPSYSSTSVVYVTVPGAETPADLQQGNVFAVQRAASYASLATTPVVLRQATANLTGTTVGDLQGTVTAVARADTSLIDVTATATHADKAAENANAVAEALITEAPDLDAPAALSPIDLTVVQPATPETAPDSPNLRTDLLLGLIVGLVIGIVIAVLRFALDTRVRTPRDVAVPRPSSLTAIPGPARSVIPWRRPRGGGGGGGSFSMLRTNLVVTSGPGAFAVAPVASGDAMVVARRLGAALVGIESTVIVIDARPTESADKAPMTAIPEQTTPKKSVARGGPKGGGARGGGLAEVLDGRTVWRDAITRSEGEPVGLGAGAITPASLRLLESPTMAALVADLGEEFEWVLVCCPPLLRSSIGATVAAAAGAAVLVADAGITGRTDYALAREQLAGLGVTTTHVVLDDVRPGDLRPIGDTKGP